MGSKRLKVGDVFAFPAGEGMVGCGQVVAMRGLPLVAIFHPRFSDPEPALEQVLASRVALVVETFDVLIKRGDWRVIGHGPAVPVPQLVFRVSIGSIDAVFLESYDTKTRRPARREEIGLVPNRTSISPKGVERMFLAVHGLAELDDSVRAHTLDSIAARAQLL